jgi:hypothetical protein
MPPTGNVHWGSVTVNPGEDADIPLYLDAPGIVDGAIWWPESASQTHNDIDLVLVDPWDTDVLESISGPGVFEKVHYDAGGISGWWKLSARRYSVTSSQTVYWAFTVRT